MAWVTKDSVEQYETPESKKEYTKQEKAANWWHQQLADRYGNGPGKHAGRLL